MKHAAQVAQADAHEDEFIRVPWGSMEGGAREAGYRASFKDLANTFGEPDSDLEEAEAGEKVIFQWVFRNVRTGKNVSLHDYKSTRIYDPENRRLPSLEKFVTLPWFEWTVSAPSQDEARHFLVALSQAVRGEAVP